MEVLFGDAFQRQKLVHAGVVYQDVDPAERFFRFGEKTLEEVYIALEQIGFYRQTKREAVMA